MLDDLKKIINTSKVFTKDEVLANKDQFKKGAKWVLALIDLDAEDSINSDLTPREFANEIITKYGGML